MVRPLPGHLSTPIVQRVATQISPLSPTLLCSSITPAMQIYEGIWIWVMSEVSVMVRVRVSCSVFISVMFSVRVAVSVSVN